MLSEKEARALLDQLCIRLGFCLPPDDVLAFTDAVFRAEGLDPSMADRHLYRQMRDMVADAFRYAGNDGV